MKKSEVTIGGVYTAKVANRLVRVRIDAESRYGGWDAVNIETGKKVRVQSPVKLRAAVEGNATLSGVKKANGKTTAKATAAAAPTPTSASTVEDVARGETPADNVPKTDGATKARVKKSKADKPKRPSGLDAAAQVLQESDRPMTAKEMVEAAEARGLWKSPGGATPHATIYAAIIREVAKKGAESRFKKTERGKFAANC